MRNQKKTSMGIRFVAMILLCTMLFSSATAVDLGGTVVDLLIPSVEGIIDTSVEEGIISRTDYTVSYDDFLGKSGTIYTDLDDYTLKLIGDESKRKYSFSKDDELAFALVLGTVLYALDATDALDYGVKVYCVSDGDSSLVDEDELSSAAAQFISLLE